MTKIRIIILSVIFVLYHTNCASQPIVDKVSETFAGVNTINVKGIFCPVEFEQGSGSNVQFEGEIRHEDSSAGLYKIRYEQKENQLDVWIEMLNPNIHKVNAVLGKINRPPGVLRFSTPKDMLINIENVSGNVTVSDVGREIKVKTSSGRITVRDISCDAVLSSVSGSISAEFVNGNLEARSSSGSIKTTDIKGTANIAAVSGSLRILNVLNDVKASTSSGSLFVSHVYSNVSGKTVSGKVELKNIKGNIQLQSSSGRISITDVVGEINASTTSGSINGNKVMITGNSSFKSSSGNINIGLLNSPISLGYDLTSSSGRLEVDNLKGQKKLTITEGAIKITSNTVSGNQKFYNH